MRHKQEDGFWDFLNSQEVCVQGRQFVKYDVIKFFSAGEKHWEEAAIRWLKLWQERIYNTILLPDALFLFQINIQIYGKLIN